MSRIRGTAAERLWHRMGALPHHDDCWLWPGALTRNGYGAIYDPSRGPVHMAKTHRVAYESFYGPPPDGLDLDHTCHNGTGCPGGDGCIHRRCLNPHHLEPVSRSENNNRGQIGFHDGKCRYERHDLTEVYLRPDGRRECRACARESQKKLRWAKRNGVADGHR